jgi:ankyrin repeat protein
VNTKVRFLVLGALLIVGLLRESSQCQDVPSKDAARVTILDLASHPQRYDGQLVRVEALLALSWEGDNFLSQPNPQSMPPEGQAYVWIYCKPEFSHQVFGPTIGYGSVYGSFTGYFHFVEKPRVVNGAFYPGKLQLDAIAASIPDPERLSLAESIRRGELEKARTIIRSGAKINVWDEHRSFPLIEAIRTDQTDFAEELLVAGADPNLTGESGDKALLQAAWYCNLRVAKTLLKRGADVNAAEVNGNTALIFASQTCPDGEMVQLLIVGGADPNARSSDGGTALRAAAGNPLVVAKLLAAGADITAKDKYGHTVESTSCNWPNLPRAEKGHAEVCSMVREALRNSSQPGLK